MQLKVGDIIRFRFKGSNTRNDWSPPALVAEHFHTMEPHERVYRKEGNPWESSKLWVVICDGMRCVANEDTHEIEILSPAGFMPKVVED